jgi:uroporphyrinogen-III synthase
LRVWVTRGQPGADETAQRLHRLGHTPLVAPVLQVQAVAAGSVDLDSIGALAFTSANGVRAFAALSDVRDLPVFAIGDATAAAAHAAGFARIDTATGDVATLARYIIARAAFCGVLLHPCAAQPAGDLVGALAHAGLSARALQVYETVETQTLPPSVLDALLADRLEALLLHSPKAARAVVRLLVNQNLAGRLGALRVVGLSPACIAPLQELPLARAKSAAHPSEDALLRALAQP